MSGHRAVIEPRDWAQTYRELSTTDAARTCNDLERLAVAAYLTGHDDASTDAWTRVHNECLRTGDLPRAVRSSFWLALTLLNRGDFALGSGWLARGQRVLGGGAADSAEAALLLALVSRLELKSGNVPKAAEIAARAMAIADRFEDRDAKAFSRLGVGLALSRKGDVAGAMSLLDEAMLAVTLGEVNPIAAGTLYCAMIEACHHAFDFERARQWTDALSQWCSEQPALVAFRGRCLVYRVEILRTSGAWPEAMQEAQRTCRWLSGLPGTLNEPRSDALPPFKYPIGPAFYELGELHRLRGEFERAEAAYRAASTHGKTPEPGLALLRMAQGKVKTAVKRIHQLLATTRQLPARVEVLGASVEIMLAAGDVAAAREAAEELERMGTQLDARMLRALASHAMGALLLAEKQPAAAISRLREAWMQWQALEAPHASARARVLMALAHRADGDEEAAQMELEAARRVFQRLAAMPDLAHVDDIISLGGQGSRQRLTRRELEIIELIASGKTNRGIAGMLSISERTVDRHVSNILTKLGVSSRSAATAYAYKHRLIA